MQSCHTLMGVALGDMMGLYYEGLSRQSIAKKNDSFEHPKLLFGRGVFSDDTEHSIIVAQCLIESRGDVKRFEKLLRKRLQKWLATLPAGIGFATLKGIIKSLFTRHSGIFSAGNAPAMRAHLIGLKYGNSDNLLKAFIKANTTITHSDPKAFYGALVIAKATYLFAHHQEDNLWQWIDQHIHDDEFQNLMNQTKENVHLNTPEFAKEIGLTKSVSGYIYHTLPIALHATYHHKENFKQAIIEVIECGGDTDTVAAITGGMIGSRAQKLPQEWVKSIVDYPITTHFIKTLSTQLDNPKIQKAKTTWWIVAFMRNIIFVIVVLISAIRRVF